MISKGFSPRFVIVFILLLFSALIFPQQIIEEIIAKVNDTIITKRKLDEMAAPFLREIFDKYQGEERGKEIKKMKTALLEEMIKVALLEYQAKLFGLTASEAEVRAVLENIKKENKIVSDEELNRQLMMEGGSLAKLKEDIKRSVLQRKLINEVIYPKIIVTEADILRYYNENIEKYTTPEEVRISQLLFPLEERDLEELKNEVMQIRSQINDANDFVNMVRKYSDTAGEQGDGDLGYFKKGELLKDIEEIAFSMKVGDISPVIETSRGFYIIYVTDRKPAEKVPFEKIKSDITTILWNQKGMEELQEYIKELRESSYVEILRPPS